MEGAAFSWMSEMILPTVSTTIFKLDPGHVIRAKDRTAMLREMSKRKESRASMGGQEEASANQVAAQTAGILVKYSEMKQEEGQIPMDGKLPGDGRLSEVSGIPQKTNPPDTHEAVTEHAIPGIRQIQSEGICGTTTDVKQIDNHPEEHPGTIAMSNTNPSDNPPASTKAPVSPPQNLAKPKRNSSPGVARNGIAKPKVSRRKPRTSRSSARASLEQPQLRRSSRKTSTSHPKPEVDWSEGIRPTDDESPKNRTASRKATSGSTPDAKSAAVDKSPRNKRKAPKTKRDSAKRQKATKEKNSIRAQPPLNTDIGDKGQSEHVQEDVESASRLVDKQLENEVVWDAIDMPAASFPVLNATDGEPKAIGQSHEIIELSSDSLFSSLSSPPPGPDSLRSNGEVTSADIHGRGLTVGQKLTDALREAGIHPQSSPDVHARLSSTQIPAGERIPEAPNGQFAQSTANSQAQNPFVSEAEMGQDEPTDASTTGEQKSPDKSNSSSDLNFRTQQTTSVSVNTLVPPIRNLSDTLSLMRGPRLLKCKGNEGEADNPMEISDDSSQAQDLPESLEMDSMPLPGEVQDYPDAGIQHPEELETSPESSDSAMPDGLTVPFVRGNESDHSPDSQKPLLSAHTSPRRIASLAFPKSITRSSIVDRNGSPRLCPQTEIRTGNSMLDVERFCLQSIRITDSGSSEDSEDSDGYECESNHRGGRRWCKFQRDMFMEYGIGPEQLTTGMTRRSAFSHGVRVASRVGQINATATGKDTEPPHEDRHGDCNMVEGIIAHDDTAPVILSSSTPSSIEHSRIQADHDVHFSQPQEGRLSTESLGLNLPRQLVQGSQDNMDWISDLQAAQQSAHSLLLKTNQHLSSHLAAEQNTIRQVLQIYRQGCNRILDDLFRAQEARMQLYRQQMASVKEQHTQICQELIQGLQELDHRVQQRP